MTETGKNSLTVILILILLISFSHNRYAAANESTQDKTLTLHNCHLDGIKTFVQCGTLSVPEDYSKPLAAMVSINIAVLPAIDNSENKTPLMFLAGGPGQAAVELAAIIKQSFTEILKTRDIILVDQRGTGQSHPLQCPDAITLGYDIYQAIPENLTAQAIKKCLSQLSGDLSQYNTENAIRDFDAVRKALGYAKINLYGASYGTRAGLIYMQMFPNSIRSAVLSGVGPIEVPIGLFGKSSARSYSLLIQHCEQETTCKNAFPNLKQELADIISRLESNPISITIPHPRLGTKTTFNISKEKLINIFRFQLYGIDSRQMLPLVIHQTYLENYLPLAGLIAAMDGHKGIYFGLMYNIICNEDYPKINQQMLSEDADNYFEGSGNQNSLRKICSLWPQYRPPNTFYQSIQADIPTLLLSGNLDPVTPPSNAEYPAKTLPNNHHIVLPNLSHDVATHSCSMQLLNEFLTTLMPKQLDESCIAKLPEVTFMTDLNGG